MGFTIGLTVVSRGEEIRQKLILLKSQTTPKNDTVLPVLPSTTQDCLCGRGVLADTIDNDPFKNDKTGFYWLLNTTYTSFTVTLQKWEGAWIDMDTITASNYGTYSIKTLTDNKYASLLLDWQIVLKDIGNLGLGEGTYRLRTVEVTIAGTQTKYTESYCLSKFTAARADGSVKIEFTNYNLLGNIEEPETFIDFGDDGFYSQIRVCGYFGLNKSTYENELVEYANGEQKWVKDEQVELYTLKLRPIPADIHNFIKTNVLQADEILITDYNKNNQNKHVQTQVIRNGNYEPRWVAGTLLAAVDVEFKTAFNNLRKKRC